jgi:DNA-binding XRE family transcriptional regulator
MNNKIKTFEEIKKDALQEGPQSYGEVMATELFGHLMAVRDQKGLSQRKWSELSGVAQKTISRLENGLDTPRLQTTLKLSAALGYTLKLVAIEETK